MASESENRVLFVTTNQWYALLLNALHKVDEVVCGQLAPQGNNQRCAAVVIENCGRTRLEICRGMNRKMSHRKINGEFTLVHPADHGFRGGKRVRLNIASMQRFPR